MKSQVRRMSYALALALVLAAPAQAQHRGETRHNPPRANQGHLPPEPQRRELSRVTPEPELHGRRAHEQHAPRESRSLVRVRPTR